MTEPPHVASLPAALVPPEKLATPIKWYGPFAKCPRKMVKFTDSSGRLPIGVEQAVKA